MRVLRILGALLFSAGAIMLGLLFSPWEEWANDHSIASFVSATDRRVGNEIDVAVDRPISIAGDVVLMFSGLWIGVLVPRQLKKFKAGYAPQPGLVADHSLDKSANPTPATSFGHAAFDPADVADARRGCPAITLQPFAVANGLEYRHQELYPGFLSTLPLWPQYTFNVCRGARPSGRLAQVNHELLEREASEGSVRSGGTYYGVRVTTRRSTRDMLNLGDRDPVDEPFAANAVWIPVTTVHVRTPEINNLPELRFARTGESLFGGKGLDRYGLPGFRVQLGPKDDDTLLAAAAAVCRSAFGNRADAFIQLRVLAGTVALTVNGYRGDGDLPELVRAAEAAAEGLAKIASQSPKGTFSSAGPAAGATPAPAGFAKPHPSYPSGYARVAGETGMFNEDPYHLARLLPRCPIPGFASGVLFGTLPGTNLVGRLVWFEHGSKFNGTVRPGVILAAAPGSATAVGGVEHEPTGLRVEVVDEVVYCWKVQRSTGRLQHHHIGTEAETALAALGIGVVR